eukprot:TRINITY_DN2130_c0_g2_i1.p1 TRINITY_DN2130_c0_g2~~TRINITY_DN2130_c0_g2_i1.p1  ORF type:complete len:184 (-),score=28.47 TRINITY_DN2130_c0_g2_i1:4-555(-)
MPKHVKYVLVVVGDGGVGKSALVLRMLHNTFVSVYDPTVEDSYRKQINVDGRPCYIEVLDTAGQEFYQCMREDYIKRGDGFVFVYDITNAHSLTVVQKIRDEFDPLRFSSVAKVLVGNKIDLSNDREVEFEEGEKLSSTWGCVCYETSALTGVNVCDVFHDLIRSLRRSQSGNSQKQKKCVIL